MREVGREAESIARTVLCLTNRLVTFVVVALMPPSCARHKRVCGLAVAYVSSKSGRVASDVANVSC